MTHLTRLYDSDDDGIIEEHDGTNSNILAGTTEVQTDSSVDTWPDKNRVWWSDRANEPYSNNGVVEIHVDSVNGDDTNDGSPSNPIASLPEAFNRVPYYVFHPYDIILKNNYTYQGGEPPEINARCFGWQDSRIEIYGAGGTVYDIDLKVSDTVSYALAASVYGSETKDNLQIKDLSFTNCRLKPRATNVEFKNCTFNTDTNSTDVPIAGYESFIITRDCTWNGTAGAVVPTHIRTVMRNPDGNVDWLIDGGGGMGNMVILTQWGTLTLNNDGSGKVNKGFQQTGDRYAEVVDNDGGVKELLFE